MSLTKAIAAFAVLSAMTAHTAPVTWADWTSATASTATGTIGSIGVSFSGNINPAAQTACGTNYWIPSAPYLSSTVDNAPPDCDIIRLTGGTGTGTQTVTFDSAVTNPIFAILSLGQPSLAVTYDFDADFTILSAGTGFFGGNATSLSRPAATILQGNEGHGAIQFDGTFTSISWTIPNPEFWHGFQVGVADEEPGGVIPEPSTIMLAVAGFALLAGRKALRGRT